MSQAVSFKVGKTNYRIIAGTNRDYLTKRTPDGYRVIEDDEQKKVVELLRKKLDTLNFTE